jgi:RNA polymerase sigma-70 factor, ECF subfamily
MDKFSLTDDTAPRSLEARELDPRLDQHRRDLTGYCYRMLGSPFEAEDAVQETLVRAWRSFDRFDERRGALRSWLYTIATHICFDMLASAQRRARPMDLAAASFPGADLGRPLPETAWVQPIPDSLVITTADPAEMAGQRETIRLAFVAALQHLPPRQRAILILRDVLCWSAAEVAQLLDTTVTSINSALQRARSTLEARRPSAHDPFRPMDRAQQKLVARYADAFERYDVRTLISLLHEDATMSMPPFPWWIRGRNEIERALLGSDGACRGDRLVQTVASGSPAFGQYRRTEEHGYEPFGLLVIEVAGECIAATTTYLGAARLLPLFHLPEQLAA